MSHARLARTLLALLIAATALLIAATAHADELDELQRQIGELTHLRQLSEAATTPLEQQLADIDARIASAQAGINAAVAENQRLARELELRETELATQYQLLAARVRTYYKRSRFFSPFMLFLAANSAGQLTRDLGYQQAAADQDKLIISQISHESVQLETNQQKQKQRQTQLTTLQAALDQEAAFYRQEIKGAKDYQADLTSQIATLTARQQEILAARAGTFVTSVGAVPLADDPNARPDFDPGFRPAYAGFSFGAYTHRAGMSQYGAFGRAKNGQSAESILSAYYQGATLEKGYSVPATIAVQGYGDLPFEENYLLGIAEMPESWGAEGGFEALKAQAVAARSFALSSSLPICPTQSCQVYTPNLKSGDWKRAVADTRGWVMVKDGTSARTYYSSTTGGFTSTKWGWIGITDTTDGSAAGDWGSRAYESLAASPWFYKGWYRESYTNTSASCGRSHPWLTQQEFADILNAWVVITNGSGGDIDRVLPVTINDCPIAGSSGNPFSTDELRGKANDLGGAYTEVTSASTSHSGTGDTTEVHLTTNRGAITISGTDFKQAFNLRAPGYISLRSPLYNIELK